jgi:hypothetical protein
VRNVNDAPQDYASGYYVEFKTATVVGFTGTPVTGPTIGQTYVGLETFRRYGYGADFSGGTAQQRVQLDDGAEYYRNSTSATAWGPWTVKTNLQTEVNLQDLLQLNGTAKVSLTGEVRWTQRLITMSAGATPQEPSGYHDLVMPADGTAIPIQGGGTRTVVAPTAGETGASGGILINNWETLWYRAVRGSNNSSLFGNFLITSYTTNANTATPGILNEASYPGTHAGEWIRVVSKDDNHKFKWGTGDVVGYGGQFGGGHDLTIANWTAMKNRGHAIGYAFTTFVANDPSNFGLTGVIRWINAGSQPFVNSQGFVDATPRPAGTIVKGVNGAPDRTWRALAAADGVEKFGGARRGNLPISATSTVVDLNSNETLYYACNIDNTGTDTGTWYVDRFAGNVSIPIHWLPVASRQTVGASNTIQFLVGGVRRAIRAGEAVWFGSNDGDIDRLHRRMGVTHTGLKYTRWSHGGIFSGTGANGLVAGPDGILVSWSNNQMIYGISDGYASWGNQYTYINMPTIGTAIPYVNTDGAVGITRVVQDISGRPYIPMSSWDSLWFIPPADTPGSGSAVGDYVMSNYLPGNHSIPAGAVRVAHYNGSRGQVTNGEGKARIAWADGTITQPGIALASTTPALRVQNDQAQGSGDWRLLTVAGQTGPGMSAVMPAVAGVVGPYAAPFTAFYRYNTVESDPRGQIELEGLIALNNNIVGTQNVAFMAGVQVRGQPIYMGQMHRSTSGDAQPIPVQLRFVNSTINGQSGVAIQVYGDSGNTLNDYATLGPNGGAQAAGVPLWLSVGPLTLPHA